MLIYLHNEHLRLTVDTLGAQMMELFGPSGRQYLWQGDPAYWNDRSPVLFPCIGRLFQDRYRFRDAEYSIGIHGFAAESMFSVTTYQDDRAVLSLSDSPETATRYPFPFSLEITYRLRGSSVEITYAVQNRGSQVMPFAIGGHPGFRVPWAEGEEFEDYTLVFSQRCQPDRIGTVAGPLLSGRVERFPLEAGRFLPLRHSLFENRVIILQNMAKEVTLQSQISGCVVTVSYPQMPYLGIWHTPKTDAPFVCIEPWTSLPGRENMIEDFSRKSDLIQLAPGRRFEITWSITITDTQAEKTP